MHGYDHHIGDYTKDTVGLSMIEDGAYRRLLDQCYASEMPLPSDRHEIYRMARASNTVERKAVDYILERYFVLRENGFHNPRADTEIGKFQAKSHKASVAAEERWARQREREAAKFGRRASDSDRAAARGDLDANAKRTHSERIVDNHANADADAHANADADAHANAMRMQCERSKNAMPPASARAHTRAGAAFRLPSSTIQERGSVVSQPSEARSGAPPPAPPEPANPAVENIEPRKVNGKSDGRGQQWSSMAYVAATALTLHLARRTNEDDDAWRDRVYMAVQERRIAR